MKIYLTNAFSLSMVNGKKFLIGFEEIDKDQVKTLFNLAKIESAIGHQSTADFISKLLDIEIPVKRQMVKLNEGDAVIVFQLLQRLPEGKILTEDEINNYPYKFFIGKVYKVSNDDNICNFIDD